jgi:hypothetical protein
MHSGMDVNDREQQTRANEPDEPARIAAAQEEPGREQRDRDDENANDPNTTTDSGAAARTTASPKIERSTRAPGEKR